MIRRPLSGGAGTIRQHKPNKKNPRGESKEEFYQRLAGLIEAAPETYFMRWKVEITSGDVARFKNECLDPILEQLCDWWMDVATDPFDPPWASGKHWRHPFGVRNFLDEGASSDLDEFLATGSMVGLRRVDRLFEELA